MSEKVYRIFAVNPGSTSTKIAFFENDRKVFFENIIHDEGKLQDIGGIVNQLPYRKKNILDSIKGKISLENVDAFAGRGGGLPPMHGGVFHVNELMCRHARNGVGVLHPGMLGPLLVYDFANEYGGEAVVVNPPGTDELQPLARVTGFKDVFRISRVHALNQKEVAERYAVSIGKKYSDLNLIIAHMGGGISVTAHSQGKMIDTVDISNGDGHMAPTRSGFIPATSLIKMCFSGRYTEADLYARVTRNGGWMDHLGTADAREVERRITEGDHYAELIYNATQYQIAKSIGAYATVLSGRVDAVLLTGGLSHSEKFVSPIKERVEYIAPVVCIPGEYEMEALACGTIRALKGQEQIYEYDGLPVWNGFDELKGA